MRETALSDFFARVIVQRNGRINLQDIVKSAKSQRFTLADRTPARLQGGGEASAEPAPRGLPPGLRQHHQDQTGADGRRCSSPTT